MSNDFINLYLWNVIFFNESVFNRTFPPQKKIVKKIRKKYESSIFSTSNNRHPNL